MKTHQTHDTQAAPHSPEDYRPALNAFRGFAAIYVVLYHLRYYSDFDWFGRIPLLKFGYIGVDFFFILSGLIVSHVYLEKSRKGGLDFWIKFIWYRLARLFPVHAFIMVLMLITAAILPLFDASRQALTTTNLTDWLSLTFLVRQWGMPEGYVWNSPAWSVSAEFFAYVVIFPLAAYFAAKRVNVKSGLGLIALGVAILSFLISIAGTVNLTAYSGPLLRVSGGFLIGMGLFMVLRSRKNFNVNTKVWDRSLLICLCLLPLMFWAAITLKTNGFSGDPLLLISFTTITVFAYLSKGKTAKFLSKPGLFWLGEISFGLYMCHIPVLRVCKYIASHFGLNTGFLFGIVCVVISIGVAHLLYNLLETPMRLYLRRQYKLYNQSRPHVITNTP